IFLDAVVSSPLERAQQTARLVADVMRLPGVQTSSSLAPAAPASGLSECLSSYAETESVLFVGHHPDVTLWVAFLAHLDASVCPLFGTASIAALRLRSPKKKAELLWFQTSDQLARA